MGEGENLERRVKEIEWMVERKERRRNIVIREIGVKEGKRKEAVEGIMRDIGVKAEVEEIRKIKENAEKDTRIIWVKLENEEQKKEIMRKKTGLKGRRKQLQRT